MLKQGTRNQDEQGGVKLKVNEGIAEITDSVGEINRFGIAGMSVAAVEVLK